MCQELCNTLERDQHHQSGTEIQFLGESGSSKLNVLASLERPLKNKVKQ